MPPRAGTASRRELLLSPRSVRHAHDAAVTAVLRARSARYTLHRHFDQGPYGGDFSTDGGYAGPGVGADINRHFDIRLAYTAHAHAGDDRGEDCDYFDAAGPAVPTR